MTAASAAGQAPAVEQRDRAVDGARAVAIVGVVLGHWLVTGLTLGPDGALRQASPLRAMPALTPATWVLQTLALFFFAGGYAAARSARRWRVAGGSYAGWLRRRLAPLPRPVGALLGGWAVALAVAAAVDVPAPTLRTVATLVASPLWFLGPYVVLTALTGPVRWATDRLGLAAAAPAVAVVAAADAGLLALPAAALGPIRTVAAWLTPWLLGVALAGGRLGGGPEAGGAAERRQRATSRPGGQAAVGPGGGWRAGAGLLLGGAALTAGLICWAGYPASAVGVPGDGRSNLAPPSLLAVALGVAQVGAALLARAWLARAWLARRPAGDRWWRPVAVLNRVALPTYLLHQSVLLALVCVTAAPPGWAPVPGLHTAPVDLTWLAWRASWLPVLAVALAGLLWLTAAASRARRGGPGAKTGRRRGTILPDCEVPPDQLEVIAVRDSDPPSRGRATRQPA